MEMKPDYNLWPTSRLCGVSNVTLKINECCLDIISDLKPSSRLFTRSSACSKCDFILQKPTIHPNRPGSFILNTEYSLELYIENGTSKVCEKSYSFGDLGKYVWNITNGACGGIEVQDAPESIMLNFGVIFTVFLIILLAYGLYKCVLTTKCCRLSRREFSFQELEADLGNPEGSDRNKSYIQARTKRYSRIATVDVFRGIAISLMIFINYGGGGYSFLRHSPWDGLNIADFVFPWFVWLMGLSMALSLRSKLRTSVSRKKIFYRILKRSFILIAIGIMINSGERASVKGLDSFRSLRLPGVLQRIGVTYLVVALVELVFMKPQRSELFGPWNLFADIVDSAIQWIIAMIVIAAHALITFMLPVPGCPTGYLGPGGLHENSKYENCTGGAAGYIDRLLLQPNHLYQRPTCMKVYHTNMPYDPEGILGTLTCIFCALLGVHAGRIILSFEGTASRVKRWILWGLLLGIVGGFLCNFHKNDGVIPVNKNLWSISYVCVTTSAAFLSFSFMYLLIDYRRYLSGSPFLYAGMNALALYTGHEIMKRFLPWSWRPLTHTHIEFLSMNLSATLIWLFIAYAMYRNNVFIVL